MSRRLFPLKSVSIGIWAIRRARKSYLLLLPEAGKFVVLVTRDADPQSKSYISTAIARNVDALLRTRNPLLDHTGDGADAAASDSVLDDSAVAFELEWGDVVGVDYRAPLIDDARLVLEAHRLVKYVFASVAEACAWYAQLYPPAYPTTEEPSPRPSRPCSPSVGARTGSHPDFSGWASAQSSSRHSFDVPSRRSAEAAALPPAPHAAAADAPPVECRRHHAVPGARGGGAAAPAAASQPQQLQSAARTGAASVFAPPPGSQAATQVPAPAAPPAAEAVQAPACQSEPPAPPPETPPRNGSLESSPGQPPTPDALLPAPSMTSLVAQPPPSADASRGAGHPTPRHLPHLPSLRLPSTPSAAQGAAVPAADSAPTPAAPDSAAASPLLVFSPRPSSAQAPPPTARRAPDSVRRSSDGGGIWSPRSVGSPHGHAPDQPCRDWPDDLHALPSPLSTPVQSHPGTAPPGQGREGPGHGRGCPAPQPGGAAPPASPCNGASDGRGGGGGGGAAAAAPPWDIAPPAAGAPAHVLYTAAAIVHQRREADGERHAWPQHQHPHHHPHSHPHAQHHHPLGVQHPSRRTHASAHGPPSRAPSRASGGLHHHARGSSRHHQGSGRRSHLAPCPLCCQPLEREEAQPLLLLPALQALQPHQAWPGLDRSAASSASSLQQLLVGAGGVAPPPQAAAWQAVAPAAAPVASNVDGGAAADVAAAAGAPPSPPPSAERSQRADNESKGDSGGGGGGAPRSSYYCRTLILTFADPALPRQLGQCMKADVRLLKLYESGLPPWAVFLPSYGLPYRPWLRRLSWLAFLLVSVVSVVLGFYDLYKNVPGLKAFVLRAFQPASALFEWLETHLTFRLSILFTYMFSKSPLFVSLLRLLTSAARVSSAALQPLTRALTLALQPLATGAAAALGTFASALGAALEALAAAGGDAWQALAAAASSVLQPLAWGLWALGAQAAWLASVLFGPPARVLWQTGLLLAEGVALLLQGPLQLLLALWSALSQTGVAVASALAPLASAAGSAWQALSLSGRAVRSAAPVVAQGVAAARRAAPAVAQGAATVRRNRWLLSSLGPLEALELCRRVALSVVRAGQAVMRLFVAMCSSLNAHRLSLLLELRWRWRALTERAWTTHAGAALAGVLQRVETQRALQEAAAAAEAAVGAEGLGQESDGDSFANSPLSAAAAAGAAAAGAAVAAAADAGQVLGPSSGGLGASSPEEAAGLLNGQAAGGPCSAGAVGASLQGGASECGVLQAGSASSAYPEARPLLAAAAPPPPPSLWRRQGGAGMPGEALKPADDAVPACLAAVVACHVKDD